METEKKIWNIQSYQEYINMLKQKENVQYRKFHKKLTTTKYEILGINVPTCRRIAKDINKTDVASFLTLTRDVYYEEVLIEGFVIASIQEEEFFFKELKRFLPKIDNWAICDGFCNSIQIAKRNPEKYFSSFLNLLKQKEPFTIRVGLIILLSFYIQKEYLETIFSWVDNIDSNHYYVEMGIAWLLAEMYIKYPKETENYLKKAKISSFARNKTIAKIRESYRVPKEKKDYILKYKIGGKK